MLKSAAAAPADKTKSENAAAPAAPPTEAAARTSGIKKDSPKTEESRDRLEVRGPEKDTSRRQVAALALSFGGEAPKNVNGNSAPTPAGDAGDERFEPAGPVSESDTSVDGVDVHTQTYENEAGGDVTVKDYERGGAQVEERSVSEPDGSSYTETTSTGADGVIQVTRIETLPNGEQNEVVTITRPDGVVETTTTHRYETDQSLEELTGGELQDIHPPGLTTPPPDTSNGPVIGPALAYEYNPPPDPAEASAGTAIGPTTVEETTRTVYDPSQDPPERVVAEGVSYTQKRGEVEDADIPGDTTYYTDQSGKYVTYTQVTENGVTRTSQTHETRLVGVNDDTGQPISATRSHTWDTHTGALTTVTDVRGFERDQTDDTIEVTIGGEDVNLRPEASVSGKDPTDHIHDRGDKLWTSGGDVHKWLDVGGDDTLDVRVTVTQSPTGQRQEIIEAGGYADPEQDGKTVTRIEDEDGNVSWLYRKVSEGGDLIETQHVIEGTEYSALDTTRYTADGGYDYTRDVRVGDQVLEETSLSRHPIVGPTHPDFNYTYQETAHSTTYDPETGELTASVDSTRYENPETGQSRSNATVTTPEGTDEIATERDPGADPPLEVTLNGSDVATVDPSGQILVNGQPIEVNPVDGTTDFAASDEVAALQALTDRAPALKKLLGPAGLLVGINDLSHGLANQQWIQAASGAGNIVGAVEGTVGLASHFARPGSAIGVWANSPALSAAGRVAGIFNVGVGVAEIFQGDVVNGGFDVGIGALGVWGLTNPYALAGSIALTLGKLGYQWIDNKLDSTRTEGIDIDR